MSYFQNLCYTSKIIPTQVWLPTKFLSDRVSLKVLSKKLIGSWRNLRHGKNKGQMLKPSDCSVKEVWCLLCQRGWIAHFLHFQTDRLLGRDLGWGPKWVNISRVQEKANVSSSGEMRSGKVSKSLGRKSCLGKSGQLWGGLPPSLVNPKTSM